MRIAYLFPGQGAQHAGMGLALYESNQTYKETFDALSEASGLDIVHAVKTGENLSLTETTQPALFTMGMALCAVLSGAGIVPQVCAGLSLGEYGALCAAGAMGGKDGVRILRKRGRFMQEAVPEGVGGLAAVVGLTYDEVQRTAQENGVYVTNYNLERQIVMGGELSKLDRACEAAKAAGARMVKMLDVSAPFHTPMLADAGERLLSELEKISVRPPRAAVYANVTGKRYEKDDDIKKTLARQVTSPILWYECMKNVLQENIDVYLELGPGGTLAGMLKKTDPAANVQSVNDPDSLAKAILACKKENV